MMRCGMRRGGYKIGCVPNGAFPPAACRQIGRIIKIDVQHRRHPELPGPLDECLRVSQHDPEENIRPTSIVNAIREL